MTKAYNMKFISFLSVYMCLLINIDAQEIYTNIGEQFPKFQIEDIEGILVNNEKLIGKPTLIVFFGTRCPPCINELNELNKELPKSYYDEFNIYIVGSTDDKERLIKFNNQKKYKFSYLPDPEQELFDQVGDHTIPRTYLLDDMGIILSQTVGFYKTPFRNLLAKMKSMSK